MEELLTLFSPWSLLVLAAAMTLTQAIKRQLKQAGAHDWLIMAVPFLTAAMGGTSLIVAGELQAKMLLLFVFVVGGAGNVLYRAYRAIGRRRG